MTTRTARVATVAMISMSLFVPAAAAAPTAASGPAGSGATALLSGTLVLVADAHRGEEHEAEHEAHEEDAAQAFLDVDGAGVPVAPSSVAGLGSGSTLTVEVPVPAVVATGVAQGAPVAVTPEAAGADEAVIPARALDAARTEPAPAASDLAAATAVAAADGQAPVPATVVTASPAATVPASRAPHEVTVAVVGIGGATDARYTDAEVARLVGAASDYWADQSGGEITYRLTGTATRYASTIGCSDPFALWQEAKSATGFRDGPEKHLVLMLPRAASRDGSCSYGLGTIGNGVATGGLSYAADASWPVLAHELGHNMSLQHANRLACTTASADSAQSLAGAFANGCSEASYGDLADVMSSSSLDAAGGLGAVGLRRLGLLGATGQQSVTAGGVTSVTLSPLGSGAGLRTVTVTDPRNGNTYHLENRQAVGRDVYGFGGRGIRDARNPGGTPAGLRVLKQGAKGTSVLLDPTPTACAPSCPFDGDVVLAPGTTFASAADGVEVRTRAGADGSVVASISVAGPGEQHWAEDPAPEAPTPTPTPTPTPMPTSTPTPAPTPKPEVVAPLPLSVVGASVTRVSAGQQATVTATVRAVGQRAAGEVAVLRDGRPIARGRLVDGRAVVRLPALPAGRTALTVVHTGTERASGGTKNLTVVVNRARPTVTAASSPTTITRGSTARITVQVGAPGVEATGSVRLLRSRSVLASADLAGGRAVLTVPADLPLGRRSLTVSYPGSSELTAGSVTVPVTVVR